MDRQVEKLDQYKVRIHTKDVFPAAIEYLAGPLVIHPNEYYAKAGPKGMNEKPVGSGPYRLVEHIVGKSIKLEKNPSPWAGSNKAGPKIDKVEIRMIPDRQTQVAEVLSAGISAPADLQRLWLTPIDWQEQRAHNNVVLIRTQRGCARGERSWTASFISSG